MAFSNGCGYFARFDVCWGNGDGKIGVAKCYIPGKG